MRQALLCSLAGPDHRPVPRGLSGIDRPGRPPARHMRTPRRRHRAPMLVAAAKRRLFTTTGGGSP